MNKSESIKSLAAALSVAQGKIKTAERDAFNPFYNSKYSTLSACWDACRQHLTENGLSIVQTPSYENGHATVETLMMHTSGEWIESKLSVGTGYTDKTGKFIPETDVQAIGSAILYCRRYAFVSMVGITSQEHDDDGNKALAKAPYKREPVKTHVPVKVEGDAPLPEQNWEAAQPDAPTAPPQAAASDGTWRTVPIHFGKNKDKMLGDLPERQVVWYATEWVGSARKKVADGGRPLSKQDEFLMAALQDATNDIQNKENAQ